MHKYPVQVSFFLSSSSPSIRNYYRTMQFNIALIASAILMVASPVLGADFQWWSGAGCTGSVQLTSNNIPANECFGLSDGESTKSISYSGVPTQARFFRSGGSQDFCTNGPPAVTTGGGSGCATAPDGFNFQSFAYN